MFLSHILWAVPQVLKPPPGEEANYVDDQTVARTLAAAVSRIGLKEMGKTDPDCRLTVLKTIEMMLDRPSRTNFKMTVTANYCFYYCILPPFPIKLLPLMVRKGEKGGIGLLTSFCPTPSTPTTSHPHPPPLVASIQNKNKLSFPTTWTLYWLEQWAGWPHF